VLLNKIGGGAIVNGTEVDVVSATQITCNVDLTGLASGFFDVIVFQEGCVGRLTDDPENVLLLVLTPTLMNGEFEEPDVGPPDCDGGGGGTSVLASGATGWNYNDDWWRDHNIWGPTCPRHVPAPDPPGEHGHYQSMTTGESIDQMAWQILSVTPGELYKLSGYFAGGGGADVPTVKIKLVDGPDPAGVSVIAETIVDDSSASYDWQYAEVQGRAVDDVMTVVWEMTNTAGDVPDADATHADGLKFELVCTIDPFADADDDGDVDHEDFALFQLCYTGVGAGAPPIPADPWYCICFDRNADDQISATDLDQFELCASGPEIPVIASCDD